MRLFQHDLEESFVYYEYPTSNHLVFTLILYIIQLNLKLNGRYLKIEIDNKNISMKLILSI